MKLSIIIPCYNKEKTIGDVINSICFMGKESIIIDNFSKYNTREKLKLLKNKVSKIATYVANCSIGFLCLTNF